MRVYQSDYIKMTNEERLQYGVELAQMMANKFLRTNNITLDPEDLAQELSIRFYEMYEDTENLGYIYTSMHNKAIDCYRAYMRTYKNMSSAELEDLEISPEASELTQLREQGYTAYDNLITREIIDTIPQDDEVKRYLLIKLVRDAIVPKEEFPILNDLDERDIYKASEYDCYTLATGNTKRPNGAWYSRRKLLEENVKKYLGIKLK